MVNAMVVICWRWERLVGYLMLWFTLSVLGMLISVLHSIILSDLRIISLQNCETSAMLAPAFW
jgi:hypothetical protein